MKLYTRIVVRSFVLASCLALALSLSHPAQAVPAELLSSIDGQLRSGQGGGSRCVSFRNIGDAMFPFDGSNDTTVRSWFAPGIFSSHSSIQGSAFEWTLINNELYINKIGASSFSAKTFPFHPYYSGKSFPLYADQYVIIASTLIPGAVVTIGDYNWRTGAWENKIVASNQGETIMVMGTESQILTGRLYLPAGSRGVESIRFCPSIANNVGWRNLGVIGNGELAHQEF